VGQDREVGKGGRRLDDGKQKDDPQAWDAERELREDRRFERRLLVKEAIVVAVIVALIVLRLTVLH
jgi:hypothetical protein